MGYRRCAARACTQPEARRSWSAAAMQARLYPPHQCQRRQQQHCCRVGRGHHSKCGQRSRQGYAGRCRRCYGLPIGQSARLLLPSNYKNPPVHSHSANPTRRAAVKDKQRGPHKTPPRRAYYRALAHLMHSESARASSAGVGIVASFAVGPLFGTRARRWPFWRCHDGLASAFGASIPSIENGNHADPKEGCTACAAW